MAAFRPPFTLVLALLIALTSVQLGTARGQARSAGALVICSGQGVVTIAVDAEGNPTGPVHICPDCALSLMASTGVMFADIPAAPEGVAALDRVLRLGLPVLPDQSGQPRARAPPGLV